jgi:hypothetical protein
MFPFNLAVRQWLGSSIFRNEQAGRLNHQKTLEMHCNLLLGCLASKADISVSKSAIYF